jgi:hypothetical protein
MLKALEIGSYTLLNILLTELPLMQSVTDTRITCYTLTKFLRFNRTIINTPPLYTQIKMGRAMGHVDPPHSKNP